MENKSWLKAGLIGAAISSVLSLFSVIPIIGCLMIPILCITWFLVPGGAGFLAAKWTKTNGNTGLGAKQGVLAGITVGVIGGFVSFILSMITSLINAGSSTMTSYFNEDTDLSFLPAGIFG